MGLSIRLAGFEIRDSITWNYGSGFPKSLNVSKALEALPACTCKVADDSLPVVGAVSPAGAVGAGVRAKAGWQKRQQGQTIERLGRR